MSAIQLLDDQHWHALSRREVVDLLETNADDGLDLFAVERRRAVRDQRVDAGARTAAVNVLMSVQAFYLFACRSMRRSLFTYNPFSNPVILLGVAAVILLQLLFTYALFMQTAFDTAPMSAFEWLVVVAIGAGVMVVMDLVGIALRRLGVD